MKKIISIFLVVILWFNLSEVLAADAGELIRGNAKFNAVIIVLGVIFGGIVFFLFRMDNRLKKLEERQNNKQ